MKELNCEKYNFLKVAEEFLKCKPKSQTGKDCESEHYICHSRALLKTTDFFFDRGAFLISVPRSHASTYVRTYVRCKLMYAGRLHDNITFHFKAALL